VADIRDAMVAALRAAGIDIDVAAVKVQRRRKSNVVEVTFIVPGEHSLRAKQIGVQLARAFRRPDEPYVRVFVVEPRKR
jgi:hypothetical protein